MMSNDMVDVSKEARAIDAGARIDAFLNDDIVKAAIGGLEKGYTDAWKTSTNAEAREQLHAKVSVLEDLQRALRAVVDNGKIVKDRAEHREKVAAAGAPQRSR